jgi:hypothetical protein
LHKENLTLLIENEILKKSVSLLRKRNEVRFGFIKAESARYSFTVVCRVMKVSKSAYYHWCKRRGKLIDAQER